MLHHRNNHLETNGSVESMDFASRFRREVKSSPVRALVRKYGPGSRHFNSIKQSFSWDGTNPEDFFKKLKAERK